MLTQKELDTIVQKCIAIKSINGVIFKVEQPSRNIAVISAAGNVALETPYYIASINKMILTALSLRLIEKKVLHPQQKIADFLSPEQLKGLLVYKGHDLSGNISIWNLMTHTSGLPCYLLDKAAGSEALMKLLAKGIDNDWDFNRVLDYVKDLKPKFTPGQTGKAYYANTNFRILAKIIESILQRPIRQILDELFEELQMQHTFVFKGNSGKELLPIYVNGDSFLPSQYFSATGYDIYSTATDQMIFLKKFFEGYFYPKDKMKETHQWNTIFFPLKYGAGQQRLALPRMLTPFKAVPEMIGHAGSVGSFAFYIPEKDLYITGTVNQVKKVRLAFQSMVRIVNKF